MNVLVIPTTSSGIQYWRLQSFVEAAWKNRVASFQNPLWEKNIKNDIHPWQGMLTDGPNYDAMFIRAFIPMIESGAVQADAIVMQMVHEEGGLELFDSLKLKYPHLPIFMEIDDNILSIPTYNQAHDVYNPRSEIRRRCIAQMRGSDGVIVSTPYLKEIYSEFNDNIHVIHNSIDFKKWDSLKKKKKPGIRIGWAGGSAHEGDFEIVKDQILAICKKYPDVKFVFVNGPAPNGLPEWAKGVRQIEHKMVWAPILKYPQLLADLDIDIGIAPLVDSAFNRGKSNLKWLENAALRIPTVAMNIGHFKSTLKHGDNAMLADEPEDFYRHMETLIIDRKLRKEIGNSARLHAELNFDINQTVKTYCKALEDGAFRKVKVEATA